MRDATTGGKQFDDVLKQLGSAAFEHGGDAGLPAARQKPDQRARHIARGCLRQWRRRRRNDKSPAPGELSFMDGVTGLTPFAAGGVIGAPTYFPLARGGIGLAGEAGRKRSCRSRAAATAGSASP